jgi:hypothetical protein
MSGTTCANFGGPGGLVSLPVTAGVASSSLTTPFERKILPGFGRKTGVQKLFFASSFRIARKSDEALDTSDCFAAATLFGHASKKSRDKFSIADPPDGTRACYAVGQADNSN